MTESEVQRLYNLLVASDFGENILKHRFLPVRSSILVEIFNISKSMNFKPMDVKLCHLFRQNADCFAHAAWDRGTVYAILAMKSALVLMSSMVPDVADTLLYSPIMEKLDRMIDSWSPQRPHVKGYPELAEIQNIYKMLPSHSWWRFGEIQMLDGKPFSLSTLVRHKNSLRLKIEETIALGIKKRVSQLQDLLAKPFKGRERAHYRSKEQQNLQRVRTLISNSALAVYDELRTSDKARNAYHQALIKAESKGHVPKADVEQARQARKSASKAFDESVTEFNSLYTSHVCPIFDVNE